MEGTFLPLDIGVAVGASIDGESERTEVIGAVESAAEALLTDLGLTELVRLRVAPEAAAVPQGWPWRICVGRDLLTPNLVANAGSVGDRVSWDLCRNRWRFITPEIAALLAATWWDHPTTPDATAHLVTVLHELARRAIRPARLRDHFPVAPELEDTDALLMAVCRDDAVRLEVRVEPRAWVDLNRDIELLRKQVQRGVMEDLGVLVPPVQLGYERGLPVGQCRIMVNDVRLPLCPLGDDLVASGVSACQTVIKAFSSALITRDTVESSLDLLTEAAPRLVESSQRRLSTATLWRLLSRLVEEDVPIDDVRGILGGAAATEGGYESDLSSYIVLAPNTGGWIPQALDTAGPPGVGLLEAVRAGLSRQITHRFSRRKHGAGFAAANTNADGGGAPASVDISRIMRVWLLPPEVEQELVRPGGLDRERLVAAVLEQVIPDGARPIVMVSVEGRRLLRDALHLEFPSLLVLSYQELSISLEIEVAGRIEL